MNQPQVLEQVVEISKTCVDQVKPSMFDLPTPCSEWNVRQLVNHMAITCRFGASTINQEPPAEDRLAEADVLGDDFQASFESYADAAVASFKAPDALERIVETPAGEVPGAFWADFPAWDLYVHTWDLSKATGIKMNQPEELTKYFLAWGQNIFSGPRDGGPIGEAVTVPSTATEIEQLVAYFGRTP